jgi:hypothetical protein
MTRAALVLTFDDAAIQLVRESMRLPKGLSGDQELRCPWNSKARKLSVEPRSAKLPQLRKVIFEGVLASERMQRRLAAILAADVAGYSRLMHNDEEATHAKLTALLMDAVAPAIAEHGGRIVKNTGDGFLAEFPSAVEAVRAALQFQNHVHELAIGDLEDRRIAFRVGINIGDVIVEPHDIWFGETQMTDFQQSPWTAPRGLDFQRHYARKPARYQRSRLDDLSKHPARQGQPIQPTYLTVDAVDG